jgi:hypothetical protein
VIAGPVRRLWLVTCRGKRLGDVQELPEEIFEASEEDLRVLVLDQSVVVLPPPQSGRGLAAVIPRLHSLHAPAQQQLPRHFAPDDLRAKTSKSRVNVCRKREINRRVHGERIEMHVLSCFLHPESRRMRREDLLGGAL